MKEIQLKAIEQIQKKLENCNPTNAKFILPMTFGVNNWRKMHGFPLLRGDMEWATRKLRTSYHNEKHHKEIVEKVLRKKKCQ